MTDQQEIADLGHLLAPCVKGVEQDLQRWLVEPRCPAELADAMRYCVMGGGKRLRPAVAYFSFAAVRGPAAEPTELARRCAVAVELVHCYSLVHDDLPAMDDDALRRGRPTAHVQFGQAMAILAGDALLTRAFAVLAESDDAGAARAARELAAGAGASGMIAGQIADMDLCRLPQGLEGLEYIHLHKTAALIRASARMGAICAGADESQLAAVTQFSQNLGLAFQLVDDLLDYSGSAEQMGKATGKDAKAGKRTHVAYLGLVEARALARRLTDQAISSLAPLQSNASSLRRLAELLTERKH